MVSCMLHAADLIRAARGPMRSSIPGQPGRSPRARDRRCAWHDAAGAAPLPPGRSFHLRLLHFNDLHGRLADVSEHAGTPVFSRLAGHIKRAREECAGNRTTGCWCLQAATI